MWITRVSKDIYLGIWRITQLNDVTSGEKQQALVDKFVKARIGQDKLTCEDWFLLSKIIDPVPKEVRVVGYSEGEKYIGSGYAYADINKSDWLDTCLMT